MNWPDGFIAVDWGTTNRRAWHVAADGRIGASMADSLGLMSVPPNGFGHAAAAIRAQLGDRPMLLAGMVGSNRGWREAPYVPCPAGSAALAAAITWLEPGRTGIVPGVSQRGAAGADVMRGEEVQLLGAMAMGQAPADGVICHPGTHTKWVVTRDGRIDRFRTSMTGEVFGLLKAHSILAPQLTGAVAADKDFGAGVAAAFAGEDVLSGLFRVRAGHLLGEDAVSPASYASGLLIGSDVRAALAREAAAAERVVLIGRADLCALYAAALAMQDVPTALVDGAEAFLAGMRLILESLR